MSRSVPRRLAVALAGTALALAPALPAHADLAATGSLVGRVADSVTGAPIPGGCVDAFGAVGVNGCSATGVVTFADLPAGDYHLTVSADILHFHGSGTANVGAGPTRVSVTLDPAAAISVRAKDAATGAALAGVCVDAVPTDSRGQSPHFGGNCTDAQGRITVGRLIPGDYRILAVPGDQQHGRQGVGRTGGTGIQEQAATVPAPAGQVTAAPAARLDGAGSIRGRVTDAATGAPIAGVCTSPYAFGPGAGPDGGPQCTDADGRFTLGGLGPYGWPVEYVDYSGTYAWKWSGGAAQRLAARAVPVTVGTAALANAALPAGGRITGRITRPGTDPYAFAAAFNAVSGDWAAAYGATDETGAYTISGLATQQVKVQATPTGAGPARWYRNAADFASATAVRARAGQTVTGIDVRLPS